MLEIPFVRGKTYSLGELRTFEAALLSAREKDKELSALWRVPYGPQADLIRLRNKELIPLLAFADHLGYHDNDTFSLMPEGHQIDARVSKAENIRNLQFTVTGPIWGRGGGSQANPGLQQHQIMKALNESDVVIGYPPFQTDEMAAADDTEEVMASGQTTVLSQRDRDRACQRGLDYAFERKSRHDGWGSTLVVYAQSFYIQLLYPEDFVQLVQSVIKKWRLRFDAVCVLDENNGFFFEKTMMPMTEKK